MDCKENEHVCKRAILAQELVVLGCQKGSSSGHVSEAAYSLGAQRPLGWSHEKGACREPSN
jgi:hypothetical protein